MVKWKIMKKIWNRRTRFHSGGFGGPPLIPIGIHWDRWQQRNKGAEKSSNSSVISGKTQTPVCVWLTVPLTHLQSGDVSLYICPVYYVWSSKEINLCPIAVSKSMKNLLAVSAKICFHFMWSLPIFFAFFELTCLFN